MSDSRPEPGRDRSRNDDRGLDDEELREVVEELTVTLRDLKHELERERQRTTRERRGLFGLPRPPSGRELLRFADEFAIPAAITVLKANVELLEHLRRAIRAAQTGREARDRTREVGEEAVDVGQDLLERVGDGLRDLRSAIEGGTIPEDAAGEDLLREVRDLQDEIDDRVSDSRERRRVDRRSERDRDRQEGDESENGTDARDRRRPGRDDSANEREDVGIDVDAELESLRERYREGDGADGTEEGPDPKSSQDGNDEGDSDGHGPESPD